MTDYNLDSDYSDQSNTKVEYQCNVSHLPYRKDYDILKYAIGKRKCINSSMSKIIDLYLIATIAVILFIILSLNWVDIGINDWAPNFWASLILKAAIFFLIIYIVDKAMKKWREKNIICYENL